MAWLVQDWIIRITSALSVNNGPRILCDYLWSAFRYLCFNGQSIPLNWNLILKIHLNIRILFINLPSIILHDLFNISSDAFSLRPRFGKLIMDLLIHVISISSSNELNLLFAWENVICIERLIKALRHLAQNEVFKALWCCWSIRCCCCMLGQWYTCPVHCSNAVYWMHHSVRWWLWSAGNILIRCLVVYVLARVVWKLSISQSGTAMRGFIMTVSQVEILRHHRLRTHIPAIFEFMSGRRSLRMTLRCVDLFATFLQICSALVIVR